MSRIDDIRARWGLVTPWPWRQEPDSLGVRRVWSGAEIVASVWRGERETENAAAIAAAPEDITHLLRVAEAAREVVRTRAEYDAAWDRFVEILEEKGDG